MFSAKEKRALKYAAYLLQREIEELNDNVTDHMLDDNKTYGEGRKYRTVVFPGFGKFYIARTSCNKSNKVFLSNDKLGDELHSTEFCPNRMRMLRFLPFGWVRKDKFRKLVEI